MSHQPNTDRGHHGGTAVEDRTTKGTATTAIVLGGLGVIAGIVAVSGNYEVLMGVVAAVLGVVALIAAGGAWKRAKDHTGEHAGTPGTNLSIAGLAAGGLAVVLGIAGMTMETTDVDEGVDRVEQDAEELGEDVEDGVDELTE